MSSGKPSIELKSIDSMVFNTLGDSTTAGAWSNATGFGANLAVANYAANVGSGIPASTTAQYNTYIAPVLLGLTAGAAQPLNICIVGNGLQNRIGRMIRMRSIKIDLALRPATSAGYAVNASSYNIANTNILPDQAIRLMLVYDRQTNGAAVNYADVLATPGGAGVGGASAYVSVTSSNNLNNRSRFLTIYDKTYILGNADTTIRKVTIYKKLNLPTVFSGSNPTHAFDCGQMLSGGLFFLAVANNAPNISQIAAGQPWAISALNTTLPGPSAVCGSFRLRFTDA